VMMKKIWAYLLGYIILVVEGTHPERFINMAFTRGIPLWDLTWSDTDTLMVKVYAQSFRTLRHVARQSKCRIRIIRKRGLPFVVFRFRRRRMLLAGALIFCLILYFLSSLIWTVDVTGTRKISAARVKDLATVKGLKPGSFCFMANRDQVEDYLLRELPGISYIEVKVGPRSQVKVVEKIDPPRSQGPCHVVAKKDGVIDSILALNGQPKVKEGDLVRKGQVLISGAIYPPPPEEDPTAPKPPPSAQKPLRYVSAQGIVYGKFWYRFYGEVFRDEVVEEKTGRSARIYCIKMGNKEIIIKGPHSIPYKYYRSQTWRSKFPRWRNKTLPVEFVTIEAEEIKHVRLRRSYEEAVDAAAGSARKKEAKGIPKGAVPVKRQYKVLGTEDDNPVRVVLTVETKEDMGVIRGFKP
jgi:similar to stage IV sporulation protein